MDFVSLQNIHDVRLDTSAKPAKDLTLTLDYHLFWLADTADYFYTVTGASRTTGGYGLHPSYDSFVGSEIDLVASYAVKRWATLQAGYDAFFRGEYVQQSLATSGSKDGDWIYLQAAVHF